MDFSQDGKLASPAPERKPTREDRERQTKPHETRSPTWEPVSKTFRSGKSPGQQCDKLLVVTGYAVPIQGQRTNETKSGFMRLSDYSNSAKVGLRALK